MAEASSKVTASHLKRDAFLYVRQSTLRQVVENTESTQRQYDLCRRAVALGWTQERVHVIDSDLGKSGASSVDRKGFQKLVTEVSLGRAGIVLGLEVSRLARNNMDWHRLLEICALSNTLILDDDGLYNPNDFNDRLLLGLKGTMSEAELHLLRARLRGGLLNKARRGELAVPLPVGFVYDNRQRVQRDPDKQVREAISIFFATYRRTGSAMGVVKHFAKNGLLFPRRLRKGHRKGELLWGELAHSRTLSLLHNPRYAGAFFFGRTKTQKNAVSGKAYQQSLDRCDWQVLIPDAHDGYITWPEYEDNQRQLKASSQARGQDRRKSPAREGPALLQGLAVCGICGRRMTLRYHSRDGCRVPDYMCQSQGIQHGRPACQAIPGATLDKAMGDLLLKSLTPLTLDVALVVQQELQQRLTETDRLRTKQVQRIRYEADLAQQRFMRVDPNNRLVADALEAEWNQKLLDLQQAQQEYERLKKDDRLQVGQEVSSQIMALATDFPRLWMAPATADKDRKRMVRLLIEDVTLTKKKDILMQVRFKGGTTTSLTLPIPKNAWQKKITPPEVVQQIDKLLDQYTDCQTAEILNKQKLKSGTGGQFHGRLVAKIRKAYGLKNRYDRLRATGMLTVQEMEQQIGVCSTTIKIWHREGLLRGHVYNGRGQALYEPPGLGAPTKGQGRKLPERKQFPKVVSDRTNEVQYEV